MTATTKCTKPSYVTLNRLCELSGRSRVTILLRMRDREITADALLDVGGRELQIGRAHV